MIIIVCLFITMSSLIYYVNLPSTRAKSIIGYINDGNNINKNTLIVENNNLWKDNYVGEITENTVNKSINYFAKELLPEYKRINNINDYYSKNSNIILMTTGISSFNEFEKIVNKVKVLIGNELELERCDFLDRSIIRTEDGIKGVLAIQYKGNDRILFNLTINNYIEKNESPIVYNADIDESKRTYDVSRIEEDLSETAIGNPRAY